MGTLNFDCCGRRTRFMRESTPDALNFALRTLKRITHAICLKHQLV
jgi:hypothetical protein